MEKKCELCGDRATLYCAADDANVCWSCDAKVHSANFLVARHARSVLCISCSQETDCKTSGPHPSPLSRLCFRCNPCTTVTRPVVEDCNGDSEEKGSSETHSYPSAANEAEDSGCTCASQESYTGQHLSRQDRRKSAVEMMGRARVSRRFHAAESKRGKPIQGRRIQKRSSSPTGLGIHALQLNSCSHPVDGGENVERSGVGSNSVLPTNEPCSPRSVLRFLPRRRSLRTIKRPSDVMWTRVTDVGPSGLQLVTAREIFVQRDTAALRRIQYQFRKFEYDLRH